MTAATSMTVRVPLTIRHRPGRKTIGTPASVGSAAVTTRGDSGLVKALARESRYRRLLDQGRYASVTEMAAAEKIERGYLGTLLRLTLLAPDIVQAILDGKVASKLALARLLEPCSQDWAEQRSVFFELYSQVPPISCEED